MQVLTKTRYELSVACVLT